MKDPVQPGSPDYEEIRRKLLERGYLEGRIERFLLRDVIRAGIGLPVLLGTAMRGALLGGVSLGALLAGTAAAANRPLQGASDLLLLWAYFTPLAALALLLLDLTAATAVMALARRRGARAGDAVTAALLAGLPTLVYLLLLNRTRGAATGWLEELIFLALAVGITLLVGRLAGLVSLAGVIGRTGEVPLRGRRTLATLALVLLPLAVGFLVAGAYMGREEIRGTPAPFSVRESERVLLIGVDGLDRGLVEAFGAHLGPDSRLLALMDGGALFGLDRERPAAPPEVWTTLATGMPPERHGIRSVGAERLPGVATPLEHQAGPRPLAAALRFLLPGRTVPTTGELRAVRTLWEIVALRRPALAVGWWASWPAVDPGAPRQMGYVVTDRVLPKLLSGAAGDRDTSPPSLFDRLAADFDRDRTSIGSDFGRSFPAGNGSREDDLLRESHLIDAYAAKVSSRLMQDETVRAAFVYLPGLDILRERLGPLEGSMRRMVEVQGALESYLRWLDRALGDLLDAASGWQIVLVADPGRQRAGRDDGFLVLSGGEVVSGCRGGTVSRLDLAPLVLELSGFPQSREMIGRIPADCRPGRRSEAGPIDSYGRRGPFREAGTSEYDPEMLERLRSLGYLN